jgi:hypothetical protein
MVVVLVRALLVEVAVVSIVTLVFVLTAIALAIGL